MELYIAIAIGIALGEIGKRLIWLGEELIWKFKNREKGKRFNLVPALDDEELLAK